MDLISVIIPVYKTEQFLNQCILSVVEQFYSNLEIILVDDGSPDYSGQICDEWARKDSRIRVLHIANGGAGKARNVGVTVSRGNYVAFVDSDDYLSPYMYDVMLKGFKDGIDIVECDYIVVKDSNARFEPLADKAESEIYSVEAAMKEHIQDRLFRQIIWNKLYRRETLEGIPFPEGKLIDDEFWTYQVLGRAKKLVHINECLYAYRQQDGSVMHEAFSLRRLQAIEAKRNRLEYIKENFRGLYPEAHKNLWLSCLYMGQMSLKHLAVSENEQAMIAIVQTMKKYPLSGDEIRELPLPYQIWGLLSKISVKSVCKVRNLLNIGF